jgi:biopolymer transport protein ExbD
MSWKVRHEGSPQAVEGLSLQQLVEGLQDGHWEPTDEVMGPQDADWVPMENHPQLEEVVADIEPPPPPFHEDESRLDMNALIDVCLVLLVFFMLTTTIAIAQKMFDTADLTAQSDKPTPVISPKQAQELMIRVNVTEGANGPVVTVEDQPVNLDNLAVVLGSLVRKEHKIELLLSHDRQVPHGAVVAVEDAAKTAGIKKVSILVPKEELKK